MNVAILCILFNAMSRVKRDRIFRKDISTLFYCTEYNDDCYCCIYRNKLFEAKTDKDLPSSNDYTGLIDGFGHSLNEK